MKILLALTSILVSANSVVIQCNFQTSNWGGSVGNIYFCSASVTSSFNPTVVTNIQGQHVADKRDSDVLGFVIDRDRSLTQFPKGIGGFYPNLTLLNWSQGNLTALTSDELEEFPNLKRIRFSLNRISYLEGDLFQRSNQLTLIEFDNNLIVNVGYDLLTNLPRLERVTFKQNPCIDVEAATRQEIQALSSQLLQDCPPRITTTLATTTTTTTAAPTCDLRCSLDDEVDELRREVKNFKETNLEQRINTLEQANHQKDQRIVSLEKQLEQQSATNSIFEKQIKELEMRLSDLLSTP